MYNAVLNFFNRAELSNYLSFFSLIFILKLDEPFIDQGSFVIFFLQSRFGF